MHYMLWVLYGLPLLNENSSLFLLITGGFGLGVEAFFLTVFFINCGDEKNLRRYIVSRLLVKITCVVVIVLITVFAIKSSSGKQTFVGVICNISFINLMPKSHIISLIKALEPESTDEYIRPFYVQKVLEMESTDKYIPPFWLTFIGFLNYIAWTAFSLIDKIDFCILIINLLGTLSSGSQLYAYYKSTAKVKTE
ncbi:PREDICTED: bidirectional sugar transporter SWEET8-like [Camelina sativa]|uniref:Bidirectional sugar transporter SWEET8-like n=1 Tax=Camelina sativa TaxID=90675 RepID=A0ABM0W9Z1_CAMSA|nr:PREDICTED: bidirectional sugar transporter SWEET8-like [Camelina sativa]